MKSSYQSIYKKTITFLVLGLIFILFLNGLTWLGLILLSLNLIYIPWKLVLNNYIPSKFRGYFKYTGFLFMTVFIAILIRLFVLEIYLVPSKSMENTLMPGDVIMVNKLVYGPALPRSPLEIPIFNMVCYAFNHDITRDSLWWKFKRYHGYSSIKNGDVLVFHHLNPKRRHTFLVKRCVGLPGDTLHIKENQVYVNGQKVVQSKHVKRQHLAYTKQPKSCKDFLIQKNITFRNDGNERILCELTTDQAKILAEKAFIDSVTCRSIRYYRKGKLFPRDKSIHWTMNDFGKLVIPEKGMKINLNSKNYALYKQVIGRFEEVELTKKEGQYYIHNEVTNCYTFKNNYYFMMGDNRTNSYDSRYWGFLPEERIIGNVNYVLFSVKDMKFNNNKFLHKIE